MKGTELLSANKQEKTPTVDYKITFHISEFNVIDKDSIKNNCCKRKVLLLLSFENLSTEEVDGLLEHELFEHDFADFNELFLEDIDISEMEVGSYSADAILKGGEKNYFGDYDDVYLQLSNITKI